MVDLRFRLADPTDAGAILALNRAAIRDLTGTDHTECQRDACAPDDAPPVFESAIRSDRSTVLLAHLDGNLAGYDVLNGPESRTDAAYVHPGHTHRHRHVAGPATGDVRPNA
jgi:hypothetical protein